MSRVVSLLRFGFRLAQNRVFRVVLMMLLGLWAFDKLVWNWTQHSFFASVGLESWFWRGFWAPLQLFAAFFAVCLGLMGAFLRPFAPRQSALDGVEAPPLRGILAQLSSLRTRIYPLARALALAFAVVLALDFARHGQEWIAVQNGGRVGFGYLGLDASVWTTFLPLWMPWLLGLWKFSLVLGFLALVTGILRALPALAAHNSAPPALSRVLWRAGALVLALRGVLYASQTLDLPRGRPLESGDAFVLAPLWILGAAWCACLSLGFARRALRKAAPFPSRARDKIARPLVLGLAALFLPALLGKLTFPLRALLPETAWLRAERERATRFAWKLPEARNAARFQSETLLVERGFPVWDEEKVLATRSRPVYRGERLVAWQSANLEFEKGKWSALVAGQSASRDSLTTSREVGKNSALALERVDLSGAQLPEKGVPIPISDAFFGLEGSPLFAESGGISLVSPLLKWAWTWRERDLFLPIDAATSPHLLFYRGTRARAQVLAPFLAPVGKPRLEMEGRNPVWTLDLRAIYTNFPGAMRGLNGDFTGANAVLAPVQMRMDARSGAVVFEAELDQKSGLKPAWRSVYPQIQPTKSLRNFDASGSVLRAQAEIFAAMRGLETTVYGPSSGLNARGEAVLRVVSAAKNEFELLESGANGPILMRSTGDLRARLGAIDAAEPNRGGAASAAAGENLESSLTVEAGEPLVWRDVRAPGGFWIARAFFATPRAGSGNSRDALPLMRSSPVLHHVVLTGMAPGARVGVGESAGAAQLDFAGQSADSNSQTRAGTATPLNSKPLSGASGEMDLSLSPTLEAALQTHRASQEAVRRGDWKAYGALSERQDALLERLRAAEKQHQKVP